MPRRCVGARTDPAGGAPTGASASALRGVLLRFAPASNASGPHTHRLGGHRRRLRHSRPGRRLHVVEEDSAVLGGRYRSAVVAAERHRRHRALLPSPQRPLLRRAGAGHTQRLAQGPLRVAPGDLGISRQACRHASVPSVPVPVLPVIVIITPVSLQLGAQRRQVGFRQAEALLSSRLCTLVLLLLRDTSPAVTALRLLVAVGQRVVVVVLLSGGGNSPTAVPATSASLAPAALSCRTAAAAVAAAGTLRRHGTRSADRARCPGAMTWRPTLLALRTTMQSARVTGVCVLGAHPVRQQRTRAQAARCGGSLPTEAQQQSRRVALALLGLVLSSSGAARAAEEREAYTFPCGFTTPCIPPPPNGEPRYTLPGSAYNPGKEAEEKFKAKLAAAKQASDKSAAQE